MNNFERSEKGFIPRFEGKVSSGPKLSGSEYTERLNTTVRKVFLSITG